MSVGVEVVFVSVQPDSRTCKMGVRICAYAVDLPRLEAFLELSLADLLIRYAKRGNDPKLHLTFTGIGRDDTFFVTPNNRVTGVITGESGRQCHTNFSEAELHTHPTLQRSARDHLSSGSIYEVEGFLRAFSDCAEVDFIHRLINGDRRWWIGSLLESANGMIPDDDYDALVRLFRQILRGLDCGYRIPDGDVGFDGVGFPLTVQNDLDFRIGRWSASESFTAVETLSYIKSLSLTFSRPPGPTGIAPEETDWNPWVQKNINSLLRIADLDYVDTNVLTFIG